MGFILVIVFATICFIFTTTYRLAIEAKYHYILDDYERAYELASIAYEKEPYNTMAFTVRQQSSVILHLRRIIKEAKQTYAQIQAITDKNHITNSDKVRIKLLCEIIIDEFDDLNFPLLDKAYLYDEAKQYRDEFEKILSALQTSPTPAKKQ